MADAAYLQFNVTFGNDADSDYFETVLRLHDVIRREAQRATTQALGPQFYIRSVSINRGSILIMVTIATAAYYAISRYKNFIESLQLLRQQLSAFLSAIFGNANLPPATIVATWSPGPALFQHRDHASVGTVRLALFALMGLFAIHALLIFALVATW
jgi:hypothetical protein